MHTQNPNTAVGVPSPTQIGPQCKFHFFLLLPSTIHSITLSFFCFILVQLTSVQDLHLSNIYTQYLALVKHYKTKIVLWEITLEINIVIIKWFQLVSFRLGFYKYNFILQVWGTIIGLEIQFYRNSPHRLYRIHYLYKMNTFRNY